MKFTKKQKKFWTFWGGISGILVGGFIIFYYKDLRGFIPAIIGSLLLVLRRKLW